LTLLAILTSVVINAIGAFIVIKRLEKIMEKQNWKDFVSKFFGMLAIKFLVSVVIVVAIIMFSGFDKVVFAISFVASHFLALLVEILYINKRYSVIKFK